MYINKYGFDFDGNTYILSDSNPNINSSQWAMYFEFNTEEQTRQTIFHNSVYNKNCRLSVYTESNYLYVRFELRYSSTITTRAAITLSKLSKVYIQASNYNTNTSIKIYIDGEFKNESIEYVPNYDFFQLYDTTDQYYSTYCNIGNTATTSSGQIYLPFLGVLSNLTFWSDNPKTETEILELFNNFNSTDAAYYESFNKTTKGTITGTEQYAIVGTEYINGELFERKETITFDSVANYTWLIGDWVYGGTMEVTVNATGNKTIRTSIYDPIEERDFLVDEQVTTGETITVELPENEARSMTIEVSTSEVQPVYFTEISYKFGLIAPLTLNNENVSAGASTYDMSVNYANNQTISDSMSVRVPKESAILFTTITESEIYFKNEKRTVLSRSLLDNFDINNQIFNLSLVRIL